MAGSVPPMMPISNPRRPAVSKTSPVTLSWNAIRALFAPMVLACHSVEG